jgi:hypothetical protein
VGQALGWHHRTVLYPGAEINQRRAIIHGLLGWLYVIYALLVPKKGKLKA